MDIFNWSDDVNTNFYAFSHKRVDNTIQSEFISGRKIGFQKNTRNIDVMECSLFLNKTEDSAFWTWFDLIGGCAGHFTCSALGSEVYKFSEVPNPSSSSQEYVTLTMTIEEAY